MTRTYYYKAKFSDGFWRARVGREDNLTHAYVVGIGKRLPYGFGFASSEEAARKEANRWLAETDITGAVEIVPATKISLAEFRQQNYVPESRTLQS